MSKIFGGSKSKSRSSNRAFDTINQNFSPLFGQATEGANALSRLLEGDASGFNAFKDAIGFDATAERGSRGITANAAARGLLRSGSTGERLQEFGERIQNEFAQNYINNLLGRAQIGLGAGRLVAGAGQESESSSKSKPGIGGFLGGIASGVAGG